jgi:thiol-disulfide isomerase/thioredoxin
MWSEVGAPAPLEVSRAGQTVRVTLRPVPYPLVLPELPGPPKVGSVAPPLKLDMFRGATELAEHKPRLLFFWATWCAICKHSLPEVLAFGKERGVEVVAITDEDAETLRPFFLTMHEPFPDIVATDSLRATFRNYGVSGMPTFVLVDADGVVRHYQAGYTVQKGLQVDGWKWQGAAAR